MYLKEMFFLSCHSWEVLSFKFERSFKKYLLINLFKFVFMSPVSIKSFTIFKDTLLKMLLLGLVYKYKYGDCNATYYSKTKCHFNFQICEHLAISYFIGKKVTIDNLKLMAIEEHILCRNYRPFSEDFTILTRKSNDFELEIMRAY